MSGKVLRHVLRWLYLKGCKAIICMPIVAPDIKVQAVLRLGGTVELVGESYTETQTYAQVTMTVSWWNLLLSSAAVMHMCITNEMLFCKSVVSAKSIDNSLRQFGSKQKLLNPLKGSNISCISLPVVILEIFIIAWNVKSAVSMVSELLQYHVIITCRLHVTWWRRDASRSLYPSHLWYVAVSMCTHLPQHPSGMISCLGSVKTR